MTDSNGGPPKGGFARMAPEILVNDFDISLSFWRDLLGFTIAYARPDDRFAYLERQGAQIMLNAIAKSNGKRADVNAKMFATRVNNGIMGTFHFDKNGDIVPTKTISFDQIRGKNGVPVYEVVLKAGA